MVQSERSTFLTSICNMMGVGETAIDAIGKCWLSCFAFSSRLSSQNADYDPGFKPAAARDGTEASKSEKPDNPSNSDNLGEKKAARDDRTKMSITRVVLLTMNLLTIAHVILAIVNLVYPVLLEMNHFTFAWAHSCVSYAIILFMSVGRPQFNLDWVKTALNSDNTHYIMYCMIFLVSSHPRPGTIIFFQNFTILLIHWHSSPSIPSRQWHSSLFWSIP